MPRAEDLFFDFITNEEISRTRGEVVVVDDSVYDRYSVNRWIASAGGSRSSCTKDVVCWYAMTDGVGWSRTPDGRDVFGRRSLSYRYTTRTVLLKAVT